MIDFIVREHLGDLSSIIALIIAIIGFAIIIYNVVKTRRLSVQIRNDMKRIDSVSEFSSAISCMDEIKTLHRMEAWQILPNKYSTLRRVLIVIREINPDISDESKKIIQSTISTLSNIENEIEKSNYSKTSPPNIPRLNQAISRQMDKLHPVLIEMQNKIGG